ncbi:hypothetical protein GCU60_18625 [Blastococcus saxobsidens]|uniref:PH domain-containing protein n=1 Tax=Blastococcus saxobsidens TaxID=138336 RepID=A0A6L9W6S7_9ACTN|nr:hypothetical protein [Blastococcus saxobsidens]NEK87758.1 hypothetical protein [Blastococcus saxobsidens]
MTTSGGTLALRPPGWARAWLVVFPVAVTVLSFSGVVTLRGDPGWGLRLLFCLFAAGLSWRLHRLGAFGAPDGRLVVRNHWRDHVLHRADIAGVGVERRARSSNTSVTLSLRDGSSVRLEVTETPFGGASRTRLEQDSATVRSWASFPSS